MTYSGAGPVLGPGVGLQQDFKLPTPVAGMSTLPAEFPLALDSPLAWSGQQLTPSDYVHQLSDDDLEEIDQALHHFNALGLDGDLVSQSNFPLPAVGPKLDYIRREIYQGKGFALLRGLDPRNYTVEDLTVIYLGLQAYIGKHLGRQDKMGNMLVHIVADQSSKQKAEHHRHSTAPITFHNEEAGDIVSWLTRSAAATGGKCIIASAYTIFNILAASRPDLIRILARSDWPFSLPEFHCRPVVFFHEGRLITNFGRAALIGSASHARPAHLPTLTGSQIEAIDAIQSIAEATRLEFSTQAGDIHFINNLAILHRRDGFVNGTGPSQRRHLVRMRLRDDELGWSIPLELQDEWDKSFSTSSTRMWHLEPMPTGYFPLRKQPN